MHNFHLISLATQKAGKTRLRFPQPAGKTSKKILFSNNSSNAFLNDRSLTNQRDGLSNSLNLTNRNFYFRLVDETKKTITSLQVVPPRSMFNPPAFISTLSLPFHGLPCKLLQGYWINLISCR